MFFNALSSNKSVIAIPVIHISNKLFQTYVFLQNQPWMAFNTVGIGTIPPYQEIIFPYIHQVQSATPPPMAAIKH